MTIPTEVYEDVLYSNGGDAAGPGASMSTDAGHYSLSQQYPGRYHPSQSWRVRVVAKFYPAGTTDYSQDFTVSLSSVPASVASDWKVWS